MEPRFRKVFVTGGAGYVGSLLVPTLLNKGYEVTVIDLFIYGEDKLEDHPNLTKVKGDIRDQDLLRDVVPGHDAFIHLACISNDPSFELNPNLGKEINLDAFEPMVEIAKEAGVKRFIYASSSSVYGIKDEENVTEALSCEPLTDYSRFKAICEILLDRHRTPSFVTTTIRPATVCGYSPRLRLDLTVNILTNHAINNGRITVFGGEQKRPNIHIKDMVRVYEMMLEAPDEKIEGKVFNAGYQNFKVKEIAEMVRNVIGDDVEIITTPSDDHRSYHISSEKIKNELGFEPIHSIEDAVRDLKEAFEAGKVPNSFDDQSYFNVKLMQNIHLS